MNTSDLLCDLYDIREMGKLCGFGKLPKDNDYLNEFFKKSN